MLFKGKFYRIKTNAKGVILTQYKTAEKKQAITELFIPESQISTVFGSK